MHTEFLYIARKEKSTLRLRHRWEDNIKMDHEERGCGLSSSRSECGPMAGCCEHVNKPSGSIKDRVAE
jgi:hypothetical protein